MEIIFNETLVLKIISIFNWFVFVCLNNATKNNMLGRNILDKTTLVRPEQWPNMIRRNCKSRINDLKT